MATQLPQFARRAATRRTSDITRLSAQFKKDIEALTGKQESSLAAYQAGVTEQMKPFEAAKATYETVSFPTYESQAAAYKSKLDQYLADVASYQSNPIEKQFKLISATGGGRFGPILTFEGGITGNEQYLEEQGYDVSTVYSPRNQMTPTSGTLTKYKSAPTKPDLGEMPKAPEAPTAPTIAAFDTSQFETERKGLEAGLQREIGERRAARLAAVGRRSSRPMLQGAG